MVLHNCNRLGRLLSSSGITELHRAFWLNFEVCSRSLSLIMTTLPQRQSPRSYLRRSGEDVMKEPQELAGVRG